MSRCLQQAGIHTPEDLKRLGSIEAAIRVSPHWDITMKVLNIHERELDAAPEQIGALIDSLASEEDSLWPVHSWPEMQPWSLWVKLLRWVLSGGKVPTQAAPEKAVDRPQPTVEGN